MKRAKALVASLSAFAALAAALGSTCLSAPLTAPPPLLAPLPAASPPPEMSVHAISTGVIHRHAAFAYRGGSFMDKRDFAVAAVLVRHPRGDVLIDTGFGQKIDEQAELLPAPFRAITSFTFASSVAQQLAATDYDPAALRWILLTHAHWDHVSGAGELRDTRVLVTKEERRFIAEGGTVAAVARSHTTVRYEHRC